MDSRHRELSPLAVGEKFLLIAGPCVLEDRDLNLQIARHVKAIAARYDLLAYFKASFDKANRTSVSSPRGPGLTEGLKLLREVREEVGIPVLTDVHLPSQVGPVAEVVDALQIPAFLSRQTDLLEAVGTACRLVNLKKGQWMAPEDVRFPVEKVRAAGAEEVLVTERGTAFGYGRWMVDMRSFSIIKEVVACSVVFDATHAVQLPGGEGKQSGGEPRFIEPLARAATAAGADGLFLEVHPRPVEAPSDAASMLPLERLEAVVESVLRVREAVRSPDPSGSERRAELEEIRS